MAKSMPRHIIKNHGSTRKFKSDKRRDLKRAINAVGNLRLGCAYTPALKEIVEVFTLLEKARKKLSVKNWGT